MRMGEVAEVKRERPRRPGPLGIVLPTIGAVDVDVVAGRQGRRQRLAPQEVIEPCERVGEIAPVRVIDLEIAGRAAMFAGAEKENALRMGRQAAEV